MIFYCNFMMQQKVNPKSFLSFRLQKEWMPQHVVSSHTFLWPLSNKVLDEGDSVFAHSWREFDRCGLNLNRFISTLRIFFIVYFLLM